MNRYKFNPDMYKLVAKNIIKYMKLKNLTMVDLAKYTKIKEQTLAKFLKDYTTISIYDLYKISVILEVGMNVFFEE